ncbi:2-succinyl-6-hydroxy-2,4-cyclohexadiene-1-carboxylate synthase [Vibrio fluvialis]
MLCSRALFSHFSSRKQRADVPVLVFLHGLLGNGDDWQSVLNALPDWDWITLDLPGHGDSQEQTCHDFADCCQQITAAVLSHVPPQTPIWLVGYSLGGRLAMTGAASGAFAALNVQGFIIEGGNFGLPSTVEREARWHNDSHWAARFRSEPIEQVLSDWYQQAVFSSLNHEQRQTLITKRSANLGHAVANMLLSTSLATQPYLLPTLKQLQTPVWYVCGAKDEKFRQLAEHSGLNYRQVEDAGHNVHHEQPAAFARIIQDLIHTLSLRAGDNNNGNHHG